MVQRNKGLKCWRKNNKRDNLVALILTGAHEFAYMLRWYLAQRRRDWEMALWIIANYSAITCVEEKILILIFSRNRKSELLADICRSFFYLDLWKEPELHFIGTTFYLHSLHLEGRLFVLQDDTWDWQDVFLHLINEHPAWESSQTLPSDAHRSWHFPAHFR